jgi:cyclophilin family peptidyl-prolyl cis-trans isomerase
MSKAPQRGKLRNPPRARQYAFIAVVIVLLVVGGSGVFVYVTRSTSTTSASSGSSTSSGSSSTSTGGFSNTPCAAQTTSTSGPNGTYALICTNNGLIVVQLSSSSTMTATVQNFVTLAKSGFYNDLVWHRIVPGFVIQSGDPTTKNGQGDRTQWGSGTSTTTIPLQIDPNEPNVAGSIAMASPSGGLASSQFFINLVNNTSLNGNYAVFGQVVSGMAVVTNIGKLPIITNTCTSTGGSECDQPVDPTEAYIVSVTIQNTP